jgi:hypothetical protein
MMTATAKPAALVEDANYFLVDSYAPFLDAASWMDVTVSGLAAGVYQFGFVDVNTTDFWTNCDNSLFKASTLISGDIGSGGTVAPLPAALPLLADGVTNMGLAARRRRT